MIANNGAARGGGTGQLRKPGKGCQYVKKLADKKVLQALTNEAYN